jgi:gamma-glutamylaminecyclotransferase
MYHRVRRRGLLWVAFRATIALVPSLFVYGTLMSGESNATELGGAAFLGPARTAPAYSLLDLGDYPGLVAGGATAVAGELYQVTPPHLVLLDVFEEHPDLYRREPVLLADGRPAVAYLLVRPPPGAPPIAGGDWRRR